ncbi:DUF2975 domain-containing protein [Lacticaseibacillus absianus]|uniref:DUF2975 domain-containing protein n=1 Tax=Lacticaseibacillus absianus TaxID=2729623 RepID=UPI0015C7FF42|nr:DUF2975 domain-containing protein [Lacticaseibacillus absianus]
MKIRLLGLKALLSAAGLAVTVMVGGLSPYALGQLRSAPWPAWLGLVGIWATTGLFYWALVGAWRLLRCVEMAQAFTVIAVDRLKRLKWAVAGMTGALTLCLPAIYHVADSGDAPGVMIIGLGLVGLPLMVTLFLAVLQRLWAAALDFKQDSDLTV